MSVLWHIITMWPQFTSELFLRNRIMCFVKTFFYLAVFLDWYFFYQIIFVYFFVYYFFYLTVIFVVYLLSIWKSVLGNGEMIKICLIEHKNLKSHPTINKYKFWSFKSIYHFGSFKEWIFLKNGCLSWNTFLKTWTFWK